MDQQHPPDEDAIADLDRNHGIHELSDALGYQRLLIANVVFHGVEKAADRAWILIDTGVIGSARMIAHAAAHRFGKNSRPAAIVLTHAHFDHVGAVEELADKWDAPVYAHELEHPFLDGHSAYPHPDTRNAGNASSLLAPLIPRAPIDVKRWLRQLPADGSLPAMPGWRWLWTPGHSAGHISLWQERDRILIVGDAFVTTRQESAYSTSTQAAEMHGPPTYLTEDWETARHSVERLAALKPELVIAGHGRAMRGETMRTALMRLASDFDKVAIPQRGRYFDSPGHAESNTVRYLPPDR